MASSTKPDPKATSLALLSSPGFLVAVCLLILNDGWLKAEFAAWWTGKLSDFAGLYAFPLLLIAIAPRARASICILTAGVFIWWKSPLSSGALQAWNSLGLWPLTRVIDYTDWFALLSLFLAHRTAHGSVVPWARSPYFGRVRALGTGLLAVFAFAATSRAAPRFSMEPATGFFVRGARPRVSTDLLATGLRRTSAPYDRPSETGPDTFAYTLIPTTGAWVVVTLELREAGCGSLLTPLSFQTLRKHPDTASIADSVYHQLVHPLQVRFQECNDSPS